MIYSKALAQQNAKSPYSLVSFDEFYIWVKSHLVASFTGYFFGLARLVLRPLSKLPSAKLSARLIVPLDSFDHSLVGRKTNNRGDRLTSSRYEIERNPPIS